MTDLAEFLELVRQDDERAKVAKHEAMISVAWVCRENPLLGGDYYRGLRPAALASARFGWHTAYVQLVATDTGDEHGPLIGLTANRHAIKPEVFVVRPIKGWEQRWTDQAHDNGQIVIADLDDDVWSHEDWADGTRPDDDHFDEWFWGVDAVLASTEVLAERIRARGHDAPVFVAPNCYDPESMKASPVPGRRIGTRLWMSGRMSGDLELYQHLFMPLVRELDLTWVHLGKEKLTGLPGEGTHGIESFAQIGCPPDHLIELASCTIPELPRLLAPHLSIGAIAMADTPYNMAKTETHAFELAAMGLPLVAVSTNPLYESIPGALRGNETVRERIEHLLDRTTWHLESEYARKWAREIAIDHESQYLAALFSAVVSTRRR